MEPSSGDSPYLVSRLQGFGATIFAEMSALATATGSINLGQGFPDTDGPTEVLDAAIAAIHGGYNQYPPGPGLPVLRQAIAEHQRRFYGIDLDPDTEVLVTAGGAPGARRAVLGDRLAPRPRGARPGGGAGAPRRGLAGVVAGRPGGAGVGADVRQLPAARRDRRRHRRAGAARSGRDGALRVRPG